MSTDKLAAGWHEPSEVGTEVTFIVCRLLSTDDLGIVPQMVALSPPNHLERYKPGKPGAERLRRFPTTTQIVSGSHLLNCYQGGREPGCFPESCASVWPDGNVIKGVLLWGWSETVARSVRG